jgi:hypothetical protein
MAKWIADAREAEMDDDKDSEEQDEAPAILMEFDFGRGGH